jgi:GT2 family glycosyltransferase/glycosyltransferase involved in cell wall biosynthesis
MSQRRDFDQLVTPGLRRLKAEFGAGIEFDVIGVFESSDQAAGWNVVTPPPTIGTSYPALSTWLQGLRPYDIGIAPLANGHSSGGPSGLRLQEYSALGLASVASDLDGHRESISNEVTGLLARPDADSFYHAMRKLVVGLPLRRSLQLNARALSRDRLKIASASELHVQRLHSLAALGRRSASGCEQLPFSPGPVPPGAGREIGQLVVPQKHGIEFSSPCRTAGLTVSRGPNISRSVAEEQRGRRDDATPQSFFRVAQCEELGCISFAGVLTGCREIVLPTGLQVDVIVPIYRGFSETQRCLESVLQSRTENRSFGRLILIDDHSPEPEINQYLSDLERRADIRLLRNTSNLGFVRSINLGIDATTSDFVLLNNDTEVHGNWLDRLAAQAYAAPRVGTVTPFSNNATICSYPDIGGTHELSDGHTVSEIDGACASANRGRAIEIPTAVGFCMLVVRGCMKEVGPFDAETFGMGYGEEVDFCQRALKRGWRHLLATDVFVFHAGETSFADSSGARKERAGALVRERYPDYERSVARWVERNPAGLARLLTTAVLRKQRGFPIVLHLLHGWGGGTEKHVSELARLLQDFSLHLVLMIQREGAVLRFSMLISEGPSWRRVSFLAPSMMDIIPFVQAFGVTQVHVQHFLAIHDQICGFLHHLGVPYDLTWHDYTAVCPRISLSRSDGSYCGEPDEQGCLQCLSQPGLKLDSEILWWRNVGTTLAREAQRLICPSVDVARRARRYVPASNIIVAPHEDALYRPSDAPTPSTLHEGKVMNIVTLGSMAKHKGASYLMDCVEAARRRSVPISWRIVGELDPDERTRADACSDVLSISGRYAIQDLPTLIEGAAPHLVFFPQRVPETYSFALSEAFAAGAPILVPAMGAFPERIAGMPWCWSYPADLPPQELVALLADIRLQIEQGEHIPETTLPRSGDLFSVQLDFYRRHYLIHTPGKQGAPVAPDYSGRKSDAPSTSHEIREDHIATTTVETQTHNKMPAESSNRPLVSFIVASYNYEAYIEQTLSSILAQTVADIEIIVVDDASIDKSCDIVRAFGDRRVQLHVNDRHLGLAATYNRAFNLSRGQYISYVDSDDWVDARKVEQQLAYFRTHPDVDIVATYTNFVDTKGIRHPRAAQLETTFNQPHDLNALDSWVGWNRIIASTVLLTRSAHERIGLRDETMEVACDFDQWARAFALGLRFGFVQSPLANVRVHEQSASQRDPLTTFLEISYLLRKNILPAIERGSSPHLITELLNWHVHQMPFNFLLTDDQRYRILALSLSPQQVPTCTSYKGECLRSSNLDLLVLGRRLHALVCAYPLHRPQDGREILWRDNELAARIRDIEWRDNELAARARDIEWRDNKLAALARDLEGHDKELAARARDVEWRDNKLAALARDLEGHDKELAALARDLEGRDNELAARAREIEWRDKELAARTRDIEWRDKELAARSRDIEWRDQQLTLIKNARKD